MRTLITATLTLVVATACSGGAASEATASSPASPVSSISPVSTSAGATASVAASPSASSTGVVGAVRTGSASVEVVGSATASVSFPGLTVPAVWAPPPGAMGLRWWGPAGQFLALGGTSFAGQQPTSGSFTLTLSVDIGATTYRFRSTGGECLVTISPALASQVGGVFQCSSVTSAKGALTVDAHGTFSAAG
jgi:hypothetical protein